MFTDVLGQPVGPSFKGQGVPDIIIILIITITIIITTTTTAATAAKDPK
jgi:hypothetical protein